MYDVRFMFASANIHRMSGTDYDMTMIRRNLER